MKAVETLLDPLQPGIYSWSEEERAPLILFVALLAAAHPTALRARSEAMRSRITEVMPPQVKHLEPFERTTREYARGTAVLGSLLDMQLTALELNHLGWRLLRRESPPWFVLGDNAVAALHRGQPHGVGSVLDPRTHVFIPLDPGSLLILEAGIPGVGSVVELDGRDGAAFAVELNRAVWARAAREVYARTAEDLLHVEPALSEADKGDNSLQFPVRPESLPRIVEERGPGATRA